MVNENWRTFSGEVVRGHQVASRRSEHYPEGTIKLQSPFFKERGLDLAGYYSATLNISIFPYTFKVKKAEYYFRQVEWTTKHPPEDFSFSRCRITHHHTGYEGLIYYPHPETKIRHHQNSSMVEVIAPYIEAIKYGDLVEIALNLNEIDVSGTLLTPDP